MKEDCILQGLVFENSLAVTLADCTNLVNVCIQKHALLPLSAKAMGRALLVASYLSASLKNAEDSCSITIKGDGLGGDIFVSGNSKLWLRGYIANANLPLQQDDKLLDIADCVGKNGTLTVLYQENGKPFMGTTNLISGDITEDFIAYFTQSEQRYTDMHLVVELDENGFCRAAVALFLQALPQVSTEQIESAIELMHKFYAIEERLQNMSVEEIWQTIIQEKILVKKYPSYTCTCARERMQAMLLTLGKAEIDEILKEQGEVKIHCHYCNTDYIFTQMDMDTLFAK